MELKDLSTDVLQTKLAELNAKRDALLAEARAITHELRMRTTVAAAEKAAGGALGPNASAVLREAMEKDHAEAAKAALERKTASRARKAAMAEAWGKVRDEAKAKGEPAPNKDAWEKVYLAAHQ